MRFLININVLILFITLPFLSLAQNESSETEPTVDSKAFQRTINSLINNSVPLMSVQELKDSMENYVILDARELNEYQVSHLEKALYIGYDNWDSSVLEAIDKDSKIIIYCSIGVRSEDIGEKLQGLGFNNVNNLYGSIFEWANQGYPLVDNAGYPTQKIHGYNRVWGRWMTNDGYKKVY